MCAGTFSSLWWNALAMEECMLREDEDDENDDMDVVGVQDSLPKF